MMQRNEKHSVPVSCPECSARLRHDGDFLRCERHGQFFTYGPRLLVQVANHSSEPPPLLPWQTLPQHPHQ
jgi:hypothetical protein